MPRLFVEHGRIENKETVSASPTWAMQRHSVTGNNFYREMQLSVKEFATTRKPVKLS